MSVEQKSPCTDERTDRANDEVLAKNFGCADRETVTSARYRSRQFSGKALRD